MERLLLDRINELLEQLSKKFADKKDTKKALKLLEKQIKNLYDLFMSSRNQGGENEDDAMFTKKPLGGMSCASCEKNIVNLQGIAKVGVITVTNLYRSVKVSPRCSL